MSTSRHNIRLFYVAELFRSLIFTLPIVIVFFQGIISLSEMSILYSFRYFIQMISELPTGAIADMVGKKVSIIIGYLLLAVAYLFLPFSTTFWEIMLFYGAIQGVSESFLSGALEALLYDSLKQDGQEDQYQQVMVRQNVIFQVGIVGAAALGGWLYEYQIAIPFYLEALTALLAGGVTFLMIEPKVDSEVFTIKNYLKQIKLGAREAFKNSRTQLISLYYILVGGFTWSATLYFTKVMMVELYPSDSIRGIIMGGLRLLNVIILTRLLKNRHIFTEKVSILFFPIVLFLSFAPGLWLQGYWALPFLGGAMMASTARWNILSKYTNQEFDSKYRSTAISTLSLLIGFVYIFLTLISGPIMENFGGIRAMYTVIGVLSFLTVMPLALQVIKKKN